VEITCDNSYLSVIVKDVTAIGFKWKGVGNLNAGFANSGITRVSATWTAKGVKATKIPEGERK
jgi:hypothetical protein